MLKMMLDKKSITLLAKWCEQASHYPMATQMLKLERWFSINKKVVTPDRVSLGQDKVSVVRLVKEAMWIHGDEKVSGIPVTHRMLQLARSAYSTYKDQMDKRAENELKRKAKEQAHKPLKEVERLKLETTKAKFTGPY